MDIFGNSDRVVSELVTGGAREQLVGSGVRDLVTGSGVRDLVTGRGVGDLVTGGRSIFELLFGRR